MTKKRDQALALLRQDPPPTRAAVAQQLSVPTSTVCYWAKVAGLPAGKPGRPPKHADGVQTQYWYRLPASVNNQALAAMRQQGYDDVAELLVDLATGTARIQIARTP